jgi:hypothetical protein
MPGVVVLVEEERLGPQSGQPTVARSTMLNEDAQSGRLKAGVNFTFFAPTAGDNRHAQSEPAQTVRMNWSAALIVGLRDV